MRATISIATCVLGVLLLLGTFLIAMPQQAQAFPFGGQASIVRNCYNRVIYSLLGPPIGGPYIWSRGTRTYQFGPPSHAGQWLLGLANSPYFCIIRLQPLTVWPGTHILMLGTSQ